MYDNSIRWLVRFAGPMLLLGCTAAGAQDFTEQWSNDPQTQAWANTYQTIYGADWQSGLDPLIGVQANPGDITVVADPVVSGRKVVRVSMSRNENFSNVANGAPRAELLFPSPVRFAQGGDYLIRWSTFLPESFIFDSQQLMIITQIHQSVSTGAPTIALTLMGTRYAISERGGSDPTSVSGSKSLCCADTDRGSWVYWTLRYIPDETGQHAVTELYKNGTSVFATSGIANTYINDQSPYLKIGLYKPNWETQPSDVTQSTVFYGPVNVSKY
jgi:hypothetical protein